MIYHLISPPQLWEHMGQVIDLAALIDCVMVSFVYMNKMGEQQEICQVGYLAIGTKSMKRRSYGLIESKTFVSLLAHYHRHILCIYSTVQ